MANSRSLNVNITSDTRGFTRGVRQVEQGVDRMERKLRVVSGASASLGTNMGGLSLRVGAFAGSLSKMAPMLASATPALVGLGGAAAAVGSSFALAAGGAAALGAGMAASMAPVLAVGKQVSSRFEEVKKAYEAVQTAQREGTAESKKNADQALASLSRSERAMVGSLGRISDLQTKVLGGASDRVFGGLSKAIDMLAPKLEGLARPFTRLGGAIGGAIERVAGLLSSGPWQSALHKFVDSATSLVRPITTVFTSIGNIIRDVATASLPYVQEAVQGIARWFADLDEKATRSRIREIVGELVEHTRSWFNLFRAVGGLFATVFGAGADKGRTFVDTMTAAVNAVTRFVRGVRQGSGAGGEFAAKAKSAFETVRAAVVRVAAAVSRWVDQNRGDINSVIKAFKTVGRFAQDVFIDTVVPIARRMARLVGQQIQALAGVIRGVVRLVSGLLSGDWAKAWGGAKQIVSSAWRGIKATVVTATQNMVEIIKDLGPKLVRAIANGLKGWGTALTQGMIAGIRAAATAVPRLAADALRGIGRSITSGISKGFGKLNPFGDGLGVGDGVGNMFPSFGGGLMGARANMAPVAGIASRFGLSVTSGLRRGAITSSGNQSYHSTGEALDVGGTPAGMLGFFRYMKNTLGGRLAELIHTPGGAGIRNGSPFIYSGQVAKDHYDHVHVAIDSGRPGVGDGLGKFSATAYGPPWGGIQGGGVTATGVNLRGNPHIYGIAVDPSRLKLGKNYYVWPNPFGYKGPFRAFDTGGAIKGNRIDFYDWRGRAAQNGWGVRSVSISDDRGSSGTSGSSGSRSSGGSSGGSKSKARKILDTWTVHSSNPGPARVDSRAIYAVDDVPEDVRAVRDFVTAQGAPRVTGPRKGGGPTKGMSMEQAAARQAVLDAQPSEFDFLDAALAESEATADTGDDRAALANILGYRQRAYQSAVASRDPRQIAQARRDLTSAEKTLSDLDATLKDNTDAIKAHTDALTSVQTELKRQTDVALSVQSTESFQIKRYLADVLSGELGRGIVRRGMTAGTGVEVAY